MSQHPTASIVRDNKMLDDNKTLKLVVAAAAGLGLLVLLSKRKKGEWRRGDKVTIKIGFTHQGAGRRVWIGVGLGPGQQNPVDMPFDRWIGDWFDVPNELEETPHYAEVIGTMPQSIPIGVKIDALKIIHTKEPPYSNESFARKLSDDWDAEVYKVVG